MGLLARIAILSLIGVIAQNSDQTIVKFRMAKDALPGAKK
jgi:hypothetical protein